MTMKKQIIIPLVGILISSTLWGMDARDTRLYQHIQLLQAVEENDKETVVKLFEQGATTDIYALFGSWQEIGKGSSTGTRHYMPNPDLLKDNQYYQIWQQFPENLLHIASRLGHTKLVKRIIKQACTEQGDNQAALTAFINQPDPRGYTPLHLAAKNNRTRTAKLLIRHYANLNATTHTGNTPHAMARFMHHDDMKALLGAPEETT